MNWGERRWPEIEREDKEKVVIQPLGSLEQHGHHLPLLTDTLLVTEVAERICADEALAERVLLLPPLWVGASHHHLDFPGTVSLPVPVYSQVVRSLAESILQAGFRRLFFLNGHGGNEVPAAQALTELTNASDEADGAHIALASYWRLAAPAMRPEDHGMRQPQLSHADEYETSMVVFLRPELVEPAEARSAPPAHDDTWWHSEHGGRVQVFKRFRRRTPRGSMGLPDEATKEKGGSLLDAIGREAIAFVKEFARWEFF